MKVKAAAKINLALDVTGRLENGYHTIESVFQTVGLYDEITVECAEEISVSCKLPDEFAAADPIPCDERNIAFKAAVLFFETLGENGGCLIKIKKGIPSQAGMGGGSTDAAAVLWCLNELTGAGFSAEKLAEMGKKLGADVPFFFTGGTAYVGGIGEEIRQIADFSGEILVIAKSTQGVSTAEAYRNIDALTQPIHPQTMKLVEAIDGSPDEAYHFVGNLFEQAVRLPEIDEIKAEMMKNRALAACMTGSGSAVFGMFGSEDDAGKCAEHLQSLGYFATVCRTVKDSIIAAEE